MHSEREMPEPISNGDAAFHHHAAVPTGMAPIYVTDLGQNDILLGRGAPIINYEGNVRFRQLVRTRKKDYVGTGRHQIKDEIARQILEEISRRKGRFLRKVDTNSEDVSSLDVKEKTKLWKVADEEVALEKVKQALRDKDPVKHHNTPASDTLLGLSNTPSTNNNNPAMMWGDLSMNPNATQQMVAGLPGVLPGALGWGGAAGLGGFNNAAAAAAMGMMQPTDQLSFMLQQRQQDFMRQQQLNLLQSQIIRNQQFELLRHQGLQQQQQQGNAQQQGLPQPQQQGPTQPQQQQQQGLAQNQEQGLAAQNQLQQQQPQAAASMGIPQVTSLQPQPTATGAFNLGTLQQQQQLIQQISNTPALLAALQANLGGPSPLTSSEQVPATTTAPPLATEALVTESEAPDSKSSQVGDDEDDDEEDSEVEAAAATVAPPTTDRKRPASSSPGTENETKKAKVEEEEGC